MNDTWFILYGGSSPDGMGPGVFVGRTTDRKKAEQHSRECWENPYSTGYVLVVSDTNVRRISSPAEWSMVP